MWSTVALQGQIHAEPKSWLCLGSKSPECASHACWVGVAKKERGTAIEDDMRGSADDG